MGGTPSSSPAISGTVGPSPRTYWVVSSTGIRRMPARRMSTWELRSTSSRWAMAGTNFSWRSTTRSAHCSGSRLRRATGSEASPASSGREEGFIGSSWCTQLGYTLTIIVIVKTQPWKRSDVLSGYGFACRNSG